LKVAKLYTFNDIRIEEMPVPVPASGEALIKTRASGICSGDVMPWYIEKKAPLVIGHEPAGEVVACGSEVDKVKPGNRVFVHHHAPCMECIYCRRSDFVQCEQWRRSRIIPGGISEYVLIPEGNLINDTLQLPDSVSYDDAALIEPAACVVKSLRRSGIKNGDTVLIIGLGVMGMMHLLLAPSYGAAKIIGADMVDYRLKKAERLGIDCTVNVDQWDLGEVIPSLTDKKGADIVIAGPNSAGVMDTALQCTAPGGTVVLFTPSMPDEKLTIAPNDIYFKDISIVTSYSCGPDDTQAALQFIEKGTLNAEKLVTHRFGIDDVETAYQTVADAGDSLKVLIVFE